MKKSIAFASATLVGLAIMSPSHADDSPKTRTVQFADLDLSKTEGAATLFGRIKAAARSVCEAHSSRELARQQRYVACVDLAVSDAVARIDAPMLTRYVASRTSASSATQRIASRR